SSTFSFDCHGSPSTTTPILCEAAVGRGRDRLDGRELRGHVYRSQLVAQSWSRGGASRRVCPASGPSRQVAEAIGRATAVPGGGQLPGRARCLPGDFEGRSASSIIIQFLICRGGTHFRANVLSAFDRFGRSPQMALDRYTTALASSGRELERGSQELAVSA